MPITYVANRLICCKIKCARDGAHSRYAAGVSEQQFLESESKRIDGCPSGKSQAFPGCPGLPAVLHRGGRGNHQIIVNEGEDT